MSTSPDWKLRRLAVRAKRALSRHKHKEASLAAYEVSLAPAADAFVTTYDRLLTLTTTRALEHKQGKAAVEVVDRKLSGWVAHIDATQAIENFDRLGFGDRPAVPDDVIAQAERLVDIVEKSQAQAPEAIPFAEELVADLSAAIEVARTEWVEAETVRDEYRATLEQNRENADRLSDLLVGFRKSLASVIGRKHPDFQGLRASKISRNVLEEGEAADLPPELVPPVVSEEDEDESPDRAVG